MSLSSSWAICFSVCTSCLDFGVVVLATVGSEGFATRALVDTPSPLFEVFTDDAFTGGFSVGVRDASAAPLGFAGVFRDAVGRSACADDVCWLDVTDVLLSVAT